MSTIKISQLPTFGVETANTSNTILLSVDLLNGITGTITATSLATGLYAFNALNVGNNTIQLPNTIAQFSASGGSYVQTNLVNLNDGGSADIVVTANTGTDSTYFIDVGYANKNYQPGQEYNNIGTAINALDGYIYAQGINSNYPGGNLIVGSTTVGREVRFIAGGGSSSNVIYKITANGLYMLNGSPIYFADGTQQSTSSPSNTYIQANYTSNAYGQAAFAAANSASANTIYSAAVNASQNTLIQSAWNTANNALPNTGGTISGNITVTGNIVAPILQTANGVNNSKNLNIFAGNDLGGYTGGSITISSGNSTAAGGIAGNINLLPGTGNTTNGIVNVQSALTVSGNITTTGLIATTGAITTGNLIINGTTTSNGSANIIGTLNVSGIVNMNAQVVLTNSTFSATQSVLTISATANVQAPSQAGTLLHLSSKANTAGRLVIDSFGVTQNTAYSIVAGRSARGTVDAPTASQTGDILLRLAGNGYGTTGFAPLGVGRIDIVATENFTDTNRGSQIIFYNNVNGSNTPIQVATFNALDAQFYGYVNPQKGFVYTPTVYPGAQTAITIDFANNALVRAQTATGLTVTLTNLLAGKEVVAWITNTAGTYQTFTHGLSATNSTLNATNYAIPGTSTILVRYMSIDGTLANTFVAVTHA